MKKIHIIALHLAFGGIEKSVCSIANLFAEQYDVEIISVYHMPNSPAFPLDERVRVRYLLDDVPNREEFKAAVRSKNLPAILREGLRSLKILIGKRRGVIGAIKAIDSGIIITTRNEDNVLLSRYGRKNVFKVAQLHQDHRFDKRLLRDMAGRYGNIDTFTVLTEQLADEVRSVLPKDSRTRVICMPNFLQHYPENISYDGREKIALAVGRLNAIKGFDRLIGCFALIREKAPDWKLRIVGEGEERKKLKELIAKHSLSDCVTLTGRKDADGVEEEMRRASLYLMSSYSEGLPFVLIEAYAAMLPAVAFDVRVGPRAVITDGIDGFLVPDGDCEAFAERAAALMHNDALRREMAENALKRSAYYSKENISRLWKTALGEE